MNKLMGGIGLLQFNCEIFCIAIACVFTMPPSFLYDLLGLVETLVLIEQCGLLSSL